jgi:hypothetical protein
MRLFTSVSGKLLARIGLSAPDLSKGTITFQASATAAFEMNLVASNVPSLI